jgi:hypothetical protein
MSNHIGYIFVEHGVDDGTWDNRRKFFYVRDIG